MNLQKRGFRFFLQLGKFILLLSILFIGFLIFLKSLDYYDPDFTKGYLIDKKDFFDGFFKFGMYAHIVTAPIILVLGTSQVFFRYELKQRKLHILLGQFYVFLVLLLSAPGALMLSFYAFGGWFSKVSFLILSSLWFWFTLKGWQMGRSGNLLAHRKFMIRSYVLTLSAIFLRILSFIFIHYLHFYGEFAYTLSSWLSWLPILIMTEVYFLRKLSSI